MGIADMLINMGVKYGSKESLDLFDKIGRVMINEALIQSALIAKDKGPYKYYEYGYVSNTEFYKTVVDPKTDSYISKYGLRNSQLLTCAPTGLKFGSV